MKLSKAQLAILAMIATSVIWGASFPIYKLALENLQPFTFAFLRFFIAALLLLPFTKSNLKIQKKDYGTLAGISLAGVSLAVSFWFLGLRLTASINGAMIAATGPIFLLLFAYLFLHEKLQRKTIIGTFISLAGVLFIIVRPTLEYNAVGSIIGNTFYILATLCGVIHVLLVKKISDKYNFITITFWSFLIGSLALLPLALFETYQYGFLQNLNVHGTVGLLYATLLSSLVAYSLFAYGVKNLKANETGIFSYIEPIVGAIVAILLLSEGLTFTFLAGALMVFLGLSVAEGKIPFHRFHRIR